MVSGVGGVSRTILAGELLDRFPLIRVYRGYARRRMWTA